MIKTRVKTFTFIEKLLFTWLLFYCAWKLIYVMLDGPSPSILAWIASAILLISVIVFAAKFMNANVSFHYVRDTDPVEKPGPYDKQERVDDPLYMHPSHEPYHSVKLGARICGVCGAKTGTLGAIAKCGEFAPPQPTPPPFPSSH